MRSRTNHIAAAAALASGVSLSALIVLIYLRYRYNSNRGRTTGTSPPSASADRPVTVRSDQVEVASADEPTGVASADQQIVLATTTSTDQQTKVASADQQTEVASVDQLVSLANQQTEVTEVSEPAVIAISSAKLQRNNQIQFEVVPRSSQEDKDDLLSESISLGQEKLQKESVAEDSASECEEQLEEDSRQAGREFVQAEEDSSEEDSEDCISAEVEQEPSATPKGCRSESKDRSTTTMSTESPLFADLCLAGSNNNNCNINNNDDSLSDRNCEESDDADELGETEKLNVETSKMTNGSPDRVSNWLARNDSYCRLQDQAAPHHLSSGGCEDPEGDSGRPSSVDTAGTSPRQLQLVLLPESLPPSGTSRGCNGHSEALAAETDLALPVHHPDRSNVIRGVSPVPGDDNDIIHQFLIPNKLGGSMVGTRGRNINYIRAKSGASVWISRNFFDKKTQVVNVRGPVECVQAALLVIKKRFPELDVKPINTAVPIQRNPALQPAMCQLSLPVGAQVDVSVCAMCRGTTVFLQQPTHPSFYHLEKMDFAIMKHYADQASVPALPRPVNPGAVCVAPFGAAWYRAIIADVYPEEDAVLMKYLDWGGYEKMPVGSLKQIRTEMMHMPFQAVEAHLAYVSPALSADEDPERQLERLSRDVHERYLAGSGRRVKCEVVYFNDVGQPCVYLYTKEAQADAPWRFLQEELVQDGLLHWFQMPHPAPQIPLS